MFFCAELIRSDPNMSQMIPSDPKYAEVILIVPYVSQVIQNDPKVVSEGMAP